jgi:hypothetical protein
VRDQQVGRRVVAPAEGVDLAKELALAEEAHQQVLGADVVLVPHLGLLPAEVGNDAGRMGPVHHVRHRLPP